MKKLFYLLLILIFFSSCTGKSIEPEHYDFLDIFRSTYKDIDSERISLYRNTIDLYYDSLSDKDKIGQLFLISIDGNSKEHVKDIFSLNTITPGGYLLFSFNINDSPEEMISFLSELNNEYLKNGCIPPYISIDHEGGVVNRLRNICFKLPSQQSIARKFTPKEAEQLYGFHGLQLRSLGIHVNLAPVVEVLTEENEQFLGDRSFGDIQHVLSYAEAQMSGMKKAGVLPVMKHFPGNTNNDPHLGLPVLNCDMTSFLEEYVHPFEELNDGTMKGVLVAHTVVPVIDEKPSCLSEKVICYLNKDSYSDNVLLLSDDFLMKALIENGYSVETSLIQAINAGINILMISEVSFDDYAGIVLKEYLENSLFKAKVDESVKKILEWKLSCNLLDIIVQQNGFFSYSAEIALPELIKSEELEMRKNAFYDAYGKVQELYDEIWWVR